MSDRGGNLGTDLAGAAGKMAVWKIMTSIFGSVGAFFFIPTIAIILLVVLLGGASAANEQAAGQPDSGGSGSTCSVSGESAIPEPYREAVAAAAARAKLPVPIMAAQIEAESNWRTNLVSSAGARGIAQFMPGTWERWGEGKDPFDPIAGLNAQGGYMGYLRNFMQKTFGIYDQIDADVVTDEKLISLILAGYNAGEGNVSKFNGIPPFTETQNYVKKIFDLAQNKYSDSCDSPTVGEIGSGKWMHPNAGARLMSPFGKRNFAGMNFHYGLDLARGGSQPVVAPADMEITLVQDHHKFYGSWIIAKQIEAPGYVFEFHHFVTGSIKVKVGQKVAVGTPLATEGTTGNSFGVHLHFQMAPPGTNPTKATMNSAIDPLPIMKKAGVLK